MKARRRSKLAAWICVAGVLACFGYAGWLIIPQVLLLSRTKVVKAEVATTTNVLGKIVPDVSLIRDHDAKGYLTWGLKVAFQYSVDSHGYNEVAETPYRTSDLPQILALRSIYQEKSEHEIRYDPAKPQSIYLEAGMPSRLWVPALLSILAAAFLGLAAGMLFSFARPPRLCSGCQAELESYYKFCATCGASVLKK